MNRIFVPAAYLSILSTLGLMGLVFFWMFWPYKVIEFKYDRLPIINPNHIIRRGEAILWKGEHVHYTDGIHVSVSKKIVCSTVINLPEVSYVTERGPYAATNSTVVVPESAPNGTCYVELQSTWAINPIRNITIEKLTEEFTIQ